MKQYLVYFAPCKSSSSSCAGEISCESEEFLFIKDGFSFGTFFLGPLWFFMKKNWRSGLIALFMFFITSAMLSFVHPSLLFLGFIIVTFFMAQEASSLISWEMEKKGYKQQAIIIARNLDEAELRFFENYKNKNKNNKYEEYVEIPSGDSK